MGIKVILIIPLIVIGLVFLNDSTPSSALSARHGTAYLEPALQSAETERLSVIVTAEKTRVAAQAVEQLGGQVSSELWLIDAVAATLPLDQLELLATAPGIISIVSNKTVIPSHGPEDWEGWISERRRKEGIFELNGDQKAPPAFLPDGGFVSVAGNGSVLIVNADGSERARLQLPDKDFKYSPIVGEDGTIFLARPNKKTLFALSPDGTLRWSFSHGEELRGGLGLGLDGTVYTVDKKRRLMALDPVTGQQFWSFQLDFASPGDVENLLTVGPDGILYQIFKADPYRLYAFDPAANFLELIKWKFVPEPDVKLDFSPLVGSQGLVFVVSRDEQRVYALNSGDGSQAFVFNTDDKISEPPTLGPDGSLYIYTDQETLYGLHPDGSVRYQFVAKPFDFRSGPVLTPDGTTAYFVGHDEKVLHAMDPATGTERWHYRMADHIKVKPRLEANGNIVVGSKGRDLVVLSPNGHVTTRLRLDHELVGDLAVGPGGRIIAQTDKKVVLAAGRLSPTWDGGPDVEPGEIKREWKLSNPVTIDAGVDIVHDTLLSDGAPITGRGVTVAVLDSGVFYTKKLQDILGDDLDKHFVGQADFVGDGGCHDGGNQYPGYCWAKKDKSKDVYGHGSHVAGIIWSQITDYATGVTMGVAPEANILSVRVLGDDGIGTYEDVIEGIQYVVQHKNEFGIRVLNMSLSSHVTTPYFADPINRAVERAWAEGIVVVAAAGNSGPGAESITVPGNDPYVITVGAFNNQRTPGYEADDVRSTWSATGPTPDGFAKPDVLAPGSYVISFMYTDKKDELKAARLALKHPDYSRTLNLFRMSGTSQATAFTSGVVALMLQAHPELSPDQVKYRLIVSARPALTFEDDLVYNIFQQGMGRIWAPEAILGDYLEDNRANWGLDIQADLAHGLGWTDLNQNGLVDEGELDPAELAHHYKGQFARLLSDDGRAYLYYTVDQNGNAVAFGAAWVDTMQWLDRDTMAVSDLTWANGRGAWNSGLLWAGGQSRGGGHSWSEGYSWGGGHSWSEAYGWGGGHSWSEAYGGGGHSWSEAYGWGGGHSWSEGYGWDGGQSWSSDIGATDWISDNWRPMYPGSLEAVTHTLDQGWLATVKMTVVDDDGNPVGEATVSGSWKNGSGEISCTTNDRGQCDLTSDLLEEKDITFTIETITHDTATFNPNRNLDPDGDPYGRSIKIKKPKHDEVQQEEPISEEPTAETTPAPTEEPAVEPTPEPTAESTPTPTEEPTADSAPAPTEETTVEQISEPAEKPTTEPTSAPTEEPAVEPTPEPTAESTPELKEESAAEPTPEPTEEPTAESTPEPEEEPAAESTPEPTD